MSLPWTDGQFWTVTAAAAGAVWLLVRPFLAGGNRQQGGSCSQCGAAPGARCASTAARPRLVAIGGGPRRR